MGIYPSPSNVYRRITKAEARKLFDAGKVVYWCGHKMRPEGPFSPAIGIHPRPWMEQATLHVGGECWKGTHTKTAWTLAFNAWMFYNANWECGYYPAYYVAE